MTAVEANGVTLGVDHFGEAAAPLILLAGGTTMLSWPDALCEALARGGRHVVRYDLRDSGASTTVDPEAPAYTLRDLAADAAALARGLDDRPAHLAGIGVGGMVAQVAALDHPDAFSALTLAGTRPVAPGRVDDDLPDHDRATMDRLFSRSMPDWSDRAAVAEHAAAGAEILGDDPGPARRTAGRIWDRTSGTNPAAQMANQMGMVFSKLNCRPRWRERLRELAIPTLVVHGRRDPFFPAGNAEALACEIPDARLLVLERAARAIPDAAAGGVETIIDAATGPSSDQEEATAFFTASARNLQRAGAAAGARRIVVVSIIGIDKFQGGYNAAKQAQEQTLLEGPLPVRIVRAAQFHEFVGPLVGWTIQDGVAYVPEMRTQLVSARVVAETLADAAEEPEIQNGRNTQGARPH